MEKENFSVKKKKGKEKMRKELWICIFVILCIIIINMLVENYTDYAVKLMDDKLDILEKSIKEDEINRKNVKDNLEEAINSWKNVYERLAYFIEHDELEKVETELTELKANIEQENYEEVVPNIEKGIFILNHIREKFRPNLKNVF